MIAHLPGRRETEATAHHAHLDRASTHETAARTAGRIAEGRGHPLHIPGSGGSGGGDSPDLPASQSSFEQR